ncbi:MAG: hypothetical protein PWQ08_157 [Clostridiales bacterium]|nr:hypothetical protein [Clostridiales bacterium]
MKKLRAVAKRYRFFLLLAGINLLLLVAVPQTGLAALALTKDNFLEMLSVLPPIFILLGLLDVWVDRQTMMKYMGEGSGVKGVLLAFLLGSAAAGPLYAAFPFAGVLLKKGVRLRNVFVFIGAWSTTKIPLLLFEAASLSWQYTLLRLGCNLVGILLIALLLEKMTTDRQKEQLYEGAQKL